MSTTFTGFSPTLLEFLAKLKENNDRDWFNARKDQYEADVRGPALDFIRAVGDDLEQISPHFLADARKSGGSMMRPYRDVRFSKDKSPYKTNVGIQFRHEEGKDAHAPGFYVHIAGDDLFMGAGIWSPKTPILTQIRQKIVDEDERFLSILDHPDFKDTWDLGGTSLKRAPKGFDPDHPLIEHLRLKSFIAVRNFTKKELHSSDFLESTLRHFVASRDFVEFLCEALELEF